MNIVVIDVETTGLDSEKDRVVEIAAITIGDHISAGSSSFVNPGRPIPPEASAIHHIIDADVSGAPALDKALASVLLPSTMEKVDIVAAHNCRFDRDFLPSLRDKKWIDTYRCSMHVWPEAPAFGNQVLRYWLGIDLPRESAHRALQDATVTAHILMRLLQERDVDDLLKLSTKAVALRKVGFGKHFGALWIDVPTDYLDWCARQNLEDPDVRFTVKTELARRREAA